MEKTSTSEDTVELTASIGLIPDLGAAEPAPIFISVAVGQDQEQKLPDRHGATALRAIQFGGLQVLKIRLRLRFSIPLLPGGNVSECILLHEYSLWIYSVYCDN